MTYMLEQVRNWRTSGAAIPDGYELAAVVEAITEGWDRDCVLKTARRGIAETDRETIGSLIAEYSLAVTVGDAIRAVEDRCRADILAEDNGQTQPLQDALAEMIGSEDEGPEVVSEYEADGVQVITELDEEGYRKTPPLARVYKDEAYLRK